jgi:hypothetical protein
MFAVIVEEWDLSKAGKALDEDRILLAVKDEAIQ